MAITYTNIFKTNVIDSLESIIKTEFPTTPIVYGRDLPMQGSQWFRMLPQVDAIQSVQTDGETRTYTVFLRYLVMIGGRDAKSTHFNRLTSIGERVKRLLANNRNYSPSGTYKYHNLLCNTITYDADLLEDENFDDLSAIQWEIELSVGEVF